jgi:3-hydroxyacyl-[acyl-carrier-protein] dehydratase
MSFEICRAIRADHPSLAGHFPGASIVPGVVILDEVAAALAEWRKDCQLTGIRAVKFVLPLKPEQPFTILFYGEGCEDGGGFLLPRRRPHGS